MTSTLRTRLKKKMPEYHLKPLQLSVAEIDNPQSVFEEFFDKYHLPDIRFCLKEWLDESLKEDEILPLNFVQIHNEVMKVIEAAWLFKELKNNR